MAAPAGAASPTWRWPLSASGAGGLGLAIRVGQVPLSGLRPLRGLRRRRGHLAQQHVSRGGLRRSLAPLFVLLQRGSLTGARPTPKPNRDPALLPRRAPSVSASRCHVRGPTPADHVSPLERTERCWATASTPITAAAGAAYGVGHPGQRRRHTFATPSLPDTAGLSSFAGPWFSFSPFAAAGALRRSGRPDPGVTRSIGISVPAHADRARARQTGQRGRGRVRLSAHAAVDPAPLSDKPFTEEQKEEKRRFARNPIGGPASSAGALSGFPRGTPLPSPRRSLWPRS